MTETNKDEYLVLARKYRPQNFSELKGQDALVRTLTNAINSGRVAHAFMLTGVRGVGKTTTARIIARALNCIGPDGNGGPTAMPCGECEQCVSISQDRNVDVLEMDAASRTGVDDIREIIDSVQYAPSAARYKIYIIDEVHMLSKQAFNALLKTLEEPPERVKFVFATTEIRKVPITVLSRCQRFDLRRIGLDVLIPYFKDLLNRESLEAEDEAVSQIARAADGSARDGLSLLDQAIALSDGKIMAQTVSDMLGLVDRALLFDLYDAVMAGKSEDAFAFLDKLYSTGADPVQIVEDLLDLTHFLTKCKVIPNHAENMALPEIERTQGGEMAAKLSMPVLTRVWQILNKGLSEVRFAPNAMHALEMVLVRLLYAADLPPPGDLVKKLENQPAGNTQAQGQNAQSAQPPNAPVATAHGQPPQMKVINGGPAQAPATDPEAEVLPVPKTLEDVVALCHEKREPILGAQISNSVVPVKFTRGRIEIALTDSADRTLTGTLSRKLSDWTGERWVISVAQMPENVTTLAEDQKKREDALKAEILSDPNVSAIVTAYPGTEITDIQDIDQ